MSGLKIAAVRDIFGIDLRTLALFRVGLAFLLLIDLALRARDLTAHYTDLGILPRSMAVEFLSSGAFSLHLLNGTVWFQAGLFILAAFVAAMLLVGFRTRLVTIVSWVLLLSLQNRNPQILSSADNLILLLTFWAMFLPLGGRFSIDAALDRRSPPVPNAYYSMASIALLIQGMSLYFFGALLKSDAQWIPDGTAVYYALQLDYRVTSFALWLREFPSLLQGLT
ncbi:MAG: HTTM domain-containing protein, partial [Rhodospirillaceae bacterium]|nr:HTTM domain-containing protein [Rhodospirillaceae bacterium]